MIKIIVYLSSIYSILFIVNFLIERDFIVKKLPINLGVKIFHRDKVNFLNLNNLQGNCDSYDTYIFNRDYVKNENSDFFPLGCKPLSDAILHQYNTYELVKSDRYGFLNEDTIWDNIKDHNIYILGDSLVKSCCVKSDFSISSQLNNNGFNTVNLAMHNATSLHMYAILKEYVPKTNKGIILFFVFENEVSSLPIRINEIPLLNQYLHDKNFSQFLTENTKKTNDYFNKFSKEKWKKDIKNYLKLNNIRIVYNYLFLDSSSEKNIDIKTDLTKMNKSLTLNKEIIYKAQSYAKSINKKFIYILIPSAVNYQSNVDNIFLKSLKKQLIEFSKDIKVIDIDEQINKNFKTKLNKSNLYSDYSNHLSEEGLIFLTEIIQQYLKEKL